MSTPDPTFDGMSPDVASLLNAARQLSPVSPDAGLIAAMSAAVTEAQLSPQPTTSRRKNMIGKLLTAKALGIVGALALTGGAAAAATGTLPASAQDGAATAASHIGLHLPQSDHGKAVSEVAHNKETTGAEHGAAVSDVASDGKSHAGEDHQAGDDHGKSGESHGKSGESHGKSGVDHPKGTETGDDATVEPPETDTAEHSSTETETGDSSGKGSTNSGGHGSSGSHSGSHSGSDDEATTTTTVG